MHEALVLAEKGRWHTAPNPVVGAVLVHDGKIVARGWHAKYGADHAEIACLKDAQTRDIDVKKTTLIVTLEPCNHHGKTPPCTEAIIAAGIRRVVIGLRDPNPLASGGIEGLENAGVEVITDIAEKACPQNPCYDAVQDFLTWQTSPYPFLILKMASTLDGRIATRTGHSQWISSKASQESVHQLRAHIGYAGGAVLIGGNTLHEDNPLLNARHESASRQPLAVCLTSRLPIENALISKRPHETVFFVPDSIAMTPQAQALQAQGVRIESLSSWGDSHALSQMLQSLRTKYACKYVLCEGGGRLGLSLLQAGFVGRLFLHMAPLLLGDAAARPLFSGNAPERLEDGLGLRFLSTHIHGGDIHIECIPNNTLVRM